MGPSLSSLDSNGRSGTGDDAPKVSLPDDGGGNSLSHIWSRKQRHAFHLLLSLFHYWHEHNYQLRWVALTTATGGDKSKLSYHHKRLRQSVERHLGFDALEFVQVATDEGHGVLHIVWAWSGERSFYVPQAWLSSEWNRIHGAPVVWIAGIGNRKKDAKRTSKYMVTQYCVEQNAFKRLSWSWWRLPVAMSRAWETLKRLGRETYGEWPHVYCRYTFTMAELIAAWEHLLESGGAVLGDTLLAIRGRDLVEVF